MDFDSYRCETCYDGTVLFSFLWLPLFLLSLVFLQSSDVFGSQKNIWIGGRDSVSDASQFSGFSQNSGIGPEFGFQLRHSPQSHKSLFLSVGIDYVSRSQQYNSNLGSVVGYTSNDFNIPLLVGITGAGYLMFGGLEAGTKISSTANGAWGAAVTFQDKSLILAPELGFGRKLKNFEILLNIELTTVIATATSGSATAPVQGSAVSLRLGYNFD